MAENSQSFHIHRRTRHKNPFLPYSVLSCQLFLLQSLPSFVKFFVCHILRSCWWPSWHRLSGVTKPLKLVRKKVETSCPKIQRVLCSSPFISSPAIHPVCWWKRQSETSSVMNEVYSLFFPLPSGQTHSAVNVFLHSSLDFWTNDLF